MRSFDRLLRNRPSGPLIYGISVFFACLAGSYLGGHFTAENAVWSALPAALVSIAVWWVFGPTRKEASASTASPSRKP